MAEARKAIWLICRSHRSGKQKPEEAAAGAECRDRAKASHRDKRRAREEAESASSWRALGSLLACRCRGDAVWSKKYSCKKIVCSGSTRSGVGDGTCALRPQATAAEAHKKLAPVSSCNTSSRSLLAPSNEHSGTISASFSSLSSASIMASSTSPSSSSFSSVGGSFRAAQLKRLTGCYECHAVADSLNVPSRDPSMRATIYPCPECGETFNKSEALELHQTVRHAVSELSPADSSRNIIEIIFQSSWLAVRTPSCKIDRILKVHNTKKTLSSFEDYRDSIKSKASLLPKKHPRCIADGNELLRFYCTTSLCSLGLNGSATLCQSTPQCKVCSIIRDGFKVNESGRIQTMATSGKAHDVTEISSTDEKRAMLVCRVIAGRVKSQDTTEEYDSVSGSAETYTNLDELYVFSPKAILPCFVVLYRNV